MIPEKTKSSTQATTNLKTLLIHHADFAHISFHTNNRDFGILKIKKL